MALAPEDAPLVALLMAAQHYGDALEAEPPADAALAPEDAPLVALLTAAQHYGEALEANPGAACPALALAGPMAEGSPLVALLMGAQHYAQALARAGTEPAADAGRSAE
jgi:hypothetical protein